MLMTRLARSHGHEQRHERSASARWDIQGLRAFAVVVVILDHLTGWPGGGFIGVDVFFVISGFLITGLLLREHDRTDHISYLGFYRRRIRRIMPAAVLVLVVTDVASRMVFTASRAHATLVDSLWGLAFSANWRFASLSTDYFAANRPVSPLQHFWSLAVEEQFYFVWPWLMLGIFAVLLRGTRTRRAAHIVVGAAIGALTLVSFWWAVIQSHSNPNVAYFSSLTRVWELGVGATLAIAAPLAFRIPNLLRPPLAWVALGGLVASLWVVHSGSSFPAPGAALPVLAAALLIAAGTYADHRRQQRFFWPLTNPVAGYLGDVSYSLYLWHFPVIILGIALIGDSTLHRWEFAATLTVLAIYAYHLVEDKIRRSDFLEPGWIRRRRRSRTTITPAYQYTLASFLVLAAIVTTAVTLHPTTPPQSALASSGLAKAVHQQTKRQLPPAQKALQHDLVTALRATEWPSDMSPTMDQAIGSFPGTVVDNTCGSLSKPVDVADCTWGAPSAQHKAMLVGDSISLAYLSTLTDVVSRQPGWSLTSVGTFGCEFMSVLLGTSIGSHQQCADRKQEAVAAINQVKPDVLFVADLYSLGTPVGSDTTMSASDYESDVQAELDKVKGSVGKVVFLAAPPMTKDPAECYTKRSTPADCAGGIPSWWYPVADAEKALAKKDHGAWIDTSSWYCVAAECPMFAGTTPMKVDDAHLTLAYQKKIVPVLAETLAANHIWKAAG